MPVNPNILLGLQQPQLQLPDPNAGMNALARAMQIRGLRDEQQINALKMDEYKRGIADTTSLNEAYKNALSPDGAFDRPKLLGDLAGRGLGSKIPSIQKSFLEVDDKTADIKKKEADRLKTELETTLKKAEHVSSVLSLARDPASYAQVRQVIAQTYGQQLPEQFDPGFVQATIAQGQTLTQSLAAEHQRLTRAETGRHNVATEGLTARGQNMTAETTRRGQNMVDSRSREGNQIQRDAARTQVLETPEGVMLIDKGTGQARPATVGGKPLAGKPSAAVEKELVGIRQQNSIVDGAIAAVEKTPSAFSMSRGMATMAGAIPESVAGRFDNDAERQARSYVFNNVSKVINERAGAAQSAQELARLRSFLPAETDNADQIKSKLQAFKTYLGDMESGTRKPQTGGTSGGWSIQKVN